MKKNKKEKDKTMVWALYKKTQNVCWYLEKCAYPVDYRYDIMLYTDHTYLHMYHQNMSISQNNTFMLYWTTLHTESRKPLSVEQTRKFCARMQCHNETDF